MRTAYVECRDDGEFPGTGFFAGWRGFTVLGYSVRKFTRAQLPMLGAGAECIVHGSVGTVRQALEQLAAPVPPDLNVPPGTEGFLRRASWETTLGQIRKMEAGPVFIKPLHQGKIFTGHVVREFGDLLQTVHFPDDCPVLAQEVVSLRSEWRVFVLRRMVVGIGHYKGDPLLFPNQRVISDILDAYENPFVAHTVDVGIADTGETLLVEMNDGYAMGDYGLSSVTYAHMIEARWDEMCSLRTVGSSPA